MSISYDKKKKIIILHKYIQKIHFQKTIEIEKKIDLTHQISRIAHWTETKRIWWRHKCPYVVKRCSEYFLDPLTCQTSFFPETLFYLYSCIHAPTRKDNAVEWHCVSCTLMLHILTRNRLTSCLRLFPRNISCQWVFLNVVKVRRSIK